MLGSRANDCRRAAAVHLATCIRVLVGSSGNGVHGAGIRRLHPAIAKFLSGASRVPAGAFDRRSKARSGLEDDASITSPELEALRWTMDGKTAREVSAAMASSEEVTKLRLQAAMRKLDCGSKYEAVLKAIRLGLIRCD